MTASSVSRKVAEVEKAKKVERRNAIIERQKPKDDIVKHIETEVRGYPQRQAVAIALSTAGKSKPPQRQKQNLKNPVGLKKGGVVKRFSPIARPQRFKGIF